MPHHHSHQHDHVHTHAMGKNIGVAFLLNFGFAIFELAGGLLTNSVAVLSDALHDLGDSLALGLSWLLHRQAQKPGDARYTYGYRRLSLLGAVINSLILIVGAAYVLGEVFARLRQPEAFSAPGLIGIALIGILVNGVAALRMREGEAQHSLHARSISLHLLEDVLGWAAALVVGVVSLFINLPILDPLLSLGITAFVLVNAGRTLWSSARLFLQAVPAGIDLGAVEAKLGAIAGVQSIHHLRLWSLDGEHHVLSAHLVVAPDAPTADLLRIKQMSRAATDDLHLQDVSIQFDFGAGDCAGEPSLSVSPVAADSR